MAKHSPQVVDISKVIAATDTGRWEVNRMVKVLQRQGQIEPLQVQPYSPDMFITFREDTWGTEIIMAAKQLEWPTLLIVVMERYEQ